MSDHFILTDRHQEVEFSGKRLGSASTEKDDSVRWTEIHLYLTDGGNYVIERLGQSLVYHLTKTECDKGTGMLVKGKHIHQESEPCDRCRPLTPEDEGFDPEQVFTHEKMLSSVEVVEQPEDLQNALSMYDRKRRVMRISHVASQALHEAAGNDPRLLNALIKRVRID